MYAFLEYRVEHVMTADPITIFPDTTLAEAEALFEEHDFDALPVLGDSGRVVGMLSKLDLCKAFVFTTAQKIPNYEEIIRQWVCPDSVDTQSMPGVQVFPVPLSVHS